MPTRLPMPTSPMNPASASSFIGTPPTIIRAISTAPTKSELEPLPKNSIMTMMIDGMYTYRILFPRVFFMNLSLGLCSASQLPNLRVSLFLFSLLAFMSSLMAFMAHARYITMATFTISKTWICLPRKTKFLTAEFLTSTLKNPKSTFISSSTSRMNDTAKPACDRYFIHLKSKRYSRNITRMPNIAMIPCSFMVAILLACEGSRGVEENIARNDMRISKRTMIRMTLSPWNSFSLFSQPLSQLSFLSVSIT